MAASHQKEEILPKSPRSPASILLDGRLKVATGGLRVPMDRIAVRHLPGSHLAAGAKKGKISYVVCLFFVSCFPQNIWCSLL